MLSTLELYGIIAGAVVLVLAILGGVIYFEAEHNKSQAIKMATMQQVIDAQKVQYDALQRDNAETKARQDALDASLSDIRVRAEQDKNKIVIPVKVLHDKDSAALANIINAQTQATLKHFEVMSKSGSK